MLRCDILSLFPVMASAYVRESIVGRACAGGQLFVGLHDIRDWAVGKHRVVDDYPFGGGPGMVLKPEPISAAIRELSSVDSMTIYLSPDGETLTTALAQKLAHEQHLILLSGHYEGIDQRVRDNYVQREVSIGDYILTNGTLAAMVVLDAVARFIPGVLGAGKSLTQDAFNDSLLSFPQYTRPAVFEGQAVPEVLLSGDHQAIADWRRANQIAKTRQRRPDLFENYQKQHEFNH